ncbi:DUF5320 domain-containing protein [Chloroflexota bacterium]
MPYGYRYGYGFGFRGGSPPWPYVGRGRGGMPRCWYPGNYGPPPYPTYARAWGEPDYWGAPATGATPYPPRMTQEQEVDFLKEEAKGVQAQLEEIEVRIKELEATEA